MEEETYVTETNGLDFTVLIERLAEEGYICEAKGHRWRDVVRGYRECTLCKRMEHLTTEWHEFDTDKYVLEVTQ